VTLRDAFRTAAHATACAIGSPYAFALAVAAIIVWAATGPAFGFSDTWQLIINTGTTVITFLVVFMIQNTQNRDSRAIHLKLDELIRALGAARNQMVDIEDLPDEELTRLAQEFQRVRDEPDAPAARRAGARAERKADPKADAKRDRDSKLPPHVAERIRRAAHSAARR